MVKLDINQRCDHVTTLPLVCCNKNATKHSTKIKKHEIKATVGYYL